MDEWTEQEEQQIIERAKTGDPEANYALSLWALSRGEEEPEEPRWNRLAAKCLVKAAQAGYGPAKEQMASLLKQSGQAPAKQSAPKQTAKRSEKPAPSRPAPEPVSDDEDEAEEEEDVGGRHSMPARRSAPASRPSAAARFTTPLRQMARRLIPQDEGKDGFDVDEARWDDGYDDETPPPARRGRRDRSHGADQDVGADSGGRWSDDKWRRLEFICVLVCAVLLIVIAVMLFSHKRGGNEGSGNTTSAIPPAGEVASADTNDNNTGNNGGVTASTYPDEATRAAIMAADLDIQPSPEDYVTEPTSGTVSVGSEYLRLRKGPNVTYDHIAQMPNGTTVSVFAKKNDWDLILYQGDDGPVYGWCSSEYVILTAGAAASAAPSDDPGNTVG